MHDYDGAKDVFVAVCEMLFLFFVNRRIYFPRGPIRGFEIFDEKLPGYGIFEEKLFRYEIFTYCISGYCTRNSNSIKGIWDI